MFGIESRRDFLKAGAVGGAAGAAALALSPEIAAAGTTETDLVELKFPTADAPWRIRRWTGTDNQGKRDNVFGLVYNRSFNQAGDTGGWKTPDVATEPAMVFSLESRWNGNAEWNWDLAPPGFDRVNGRDWDARPLSVFYTYATRDSQFGFGDSDGGGVRLFGGPNRGGLRVRSASGSQSIPSLWLERPDGTTFLKVHPNSGHIVLTPSTSSASNIIGAQWSGAIRIFNASVGLDIGGTSPTDTAFKSRVAKPGTEGETLFRVQTDGKLLWNEDTSLERSAAGLLRTDGKLAATQGVGVGNSAAASNPNKVVAKAEVFNASGASIGFLPIYDRIN